MTHLPRSREDDAALILDSLERPEAFGALYDRHAAAIHWFIARRLGNDIADDLAADTFLAAFRQRDRYQRERLDARPWLYGIAVRLIGRHRRSEVRMWRAMARTGLEVSTDADLDAVDDRLAVTSGVHRALAAGIARMGTRDRDVLLLVAWADLSYQEVASALDIPVGTVRSRLSRARRKLTAELGGPQTKPATEEELWHARA